MENGRMARNKNGWVKESIQDQLNHHTMMAIMKSNIDVDTIFLLGLFIINFNVFSFYN